MKMMLQSMDLQVALLGLAGLLLCLMQRVLQVDAHFTFDLDLQSSSTSGTCDLFLSPECETYLRFCLRGMRSERSRNIDDCPLGIHGRIDKDSLPSMASISSDNLWPESFQLYIKALDEDLNEDDDVDFIFIDNTRQPLQGYTTSMPVTGDNRRVTVTLRFRVRCQDGYHGQDCNTICETNERCFSNGTVECVTGWESPNTHCNTPICMAGCHPVGGTCSTPGQCQCNQGWQGDLCDQCTPAPGCHLVGGNCSIPGQCECNQGWQGDLCDQCTLAPGCSVVGGFCNIPGECLCHKGFGPPGLCNEAHNACSDSPCEDGATCIPELGTENYSCHCLPGYTGPSCDINIDESRNACSDSPCEDGATCIPELGTENYSCHCLPGYTGPSCDTNIDECEEASCPENSTCEDEINSFRCVCNDGYKALNCTETEDSQPQMRAPSPATIAGAIFGCLLLLLCVLALCIILPLVLLLVKRRRQKKLAISSPSESANLYSSYKSSSPTDNFELSTVPRDDTDNHAGTLADNPLYGGPTSNAAVNSTNVPEASISPNTLHKVDNPIYGELDENTTIISTNVPEASLSPNTLHKVDNPIYGEPDENAAVISANVPEASLSPSTLHRVDNPVYGEPHENPTWIYSEPSLSRTRISGGATEAGHHIEAYAYTRMNCEDATSGDSGPQLRNANPYDYATTTGDTNTGSAVPQNSYHTLDYKKVKETPPPVRMSKREGAGYEALQF